MIIWRIPSRLPYLEGGNAMPLSERSTVQLIDPKDHHQDHT